MGNDEIFARTYDVSAEALWKAVKQTIPALKGAKVKGIQDAQRRAEFSTGMSWTSWGEEMTAIVESLGESRSLLRMTGRPHTSLLTTRWGEEIHQHEFVRSFTDAVARALD